MTTTQQVSGQIITRGNRVVIILQKVRSRRLPYLQHRQRKRRVPTIKDQYVLKLLAEGLTNKAIGYNLGIRENTIKRYCHDMYLRMGVTNRVQAIIQWQEKTGYKFEFEYSGNHNQVLSKRETEVAELIAQGDSNKIIAGKLERTEGTIRKCTVRVFNKLQVDTRLQAALVYREFYQDKDKDKAIESSRRR